MGIISLLKKLPVDIGQAERKHDSAGKTIAFSYIADGHGKKALDIGCRDGYWSERLKEKGYEVSSLDIEPLYEGALKYDVENGLPYPDKTFDLVWCTEVIEHLYDPRKFLKEINRVKTNEGTMVLTTPNSNWWLYWIIKLWGWTPKRVQNPDHKQFFTFYGMRALAYPYDFDIFGYFPYAIKFWRISAFVGWLSPTFILVNRHPPMRNTTADQE